MSSILNNIDKIPNDIYHVDTPNSSSTILWSIKWTVLSVIIIAILHNLYGFYQSVSSPPKLRDLANERKDEYEVMRQHIQIKRSHPSKIQISNIKAQETYHEKTPDNSQPSPNGDKTMLKNFMNELSSGIGDKTSPSERLELGDVSTMDSNWSTI